jgi:hypothetical protein
MKYVFLCGLHRSGTTILAHCVGKLKNCTGFENTGAPGDEGSFSRTFTPGKLLWCRRQIWLCSPGAHNGRVASANADKRVPAPPELGGLLG